MKTEKTDHTNHCFHIRFLAILLLYRPLSILAKLRVSIWGKISPSPQLNLTDFSPNVDNHTAKIKCIENEFDTTLVIWLQWGKS